MCWSRFPRRRSNRRFAYSHRFSFPSPPGGMHTEALTEEGLRLFPALAAFDDFYLAGGTALALQIGHRISVDFDLFCNDAVRHLKRDHCFDLIEAYPVHVFNPPQVGL